MDTGPGGDALSPHAESTLHILPLPAVITNQKTSNENTLHLQEFLLMKTGRMKIPLSIVMYFPFFSSSLKSLYAFSILSLRKV